MNILSCPNSVKPIAVELGSMEATSGLRAFAVGNVFTLYFVAAENADRPDANVGKFCELAD